MSDRYFIVPVLCLLASVSASAAIPGAENKQAFTTSDFIKSKLDYNRRTMTERYKAAGRRNATWDEEAIQLLDGVAAAFASGSAESWVDWRPQVPSMDQMIEWGQSALVNSCDDPMVLYCLAAMLDDSGRDPQALPILQRALKGFPDSTYHPTRTIAAAQRALRNPVLQNDASAKAFCEGLILDALPKAIVKADFKQHDRRMIYALLENVFESPADFDVVRKRFDALKVAHDPDPWLLHALSGKYCIKAAWQARGTAFAQEVQEQQWRGFYASLEEARKHLREAMRLQPGFPEPATAMISVTGGASDIDQRDFRQWFEQAVRAQFDYEPAYSAMFWALLPRWNGSHEEMFQFGLECAQTKRYDTCVPYQLIVAMNRIKGDRASDVSFFQRPGLYENIKEVLTQYSDRVDDPGAKAGYGSMLAAVSWRAREFPEARKILDVLEDQEILASAFAEMRGFAPIAISEVYTATSAHQPLLKKAEAAVVEGKFADAITAYRQVEGILKDEGKELLFVRARRVGLEFEQKLAGGEWITVEPDAQLTGWYPVSGTWIEQKGTVLATTGRQGEALLVSPVDLPFDYELQCTVENLSDPGRETGAGPIVHFASQDELYGFLIWRPESELFIRSGPRYLQRVPTKVVPKNQIHAHVGQRAITVTVNGHVSVRDYPVRESPIPFGRYLALGTQYGGDARIVRFSNIKVRKIR